MGTINTSDFRKGLRVKLDGDPYLMTECNFVKPGKGQAFYKCRLKHLIRGTTIDRTWKSGDSIESADVEEISAQYLYRQGEKFVFMDNQNYEQYELNPEQVGDTWKYIKEATVCDMTLYNGNPITVAPPNHVVLKIEFCEPGARGNTTMNVSKPCKMETGAEFLCPVFVNIGDMIKIDTRTGEYVERSKE